jgi:F-type H+-transporting ATPase subunit delta
MRGTSQASRDAAIDRFLPVLTAAGAKASALGEDLYGVVDVLDSSGALRRALTDPAAAPDAKSTLAKRLLKGKVDKRVTDVVSDLARSRWARERDLGDAVEDIALDAVLAGAQHEGVLETVEDELFRLDRILVGQRRLRQALEDVKAAGEARSSLVDTLLAGKVTDRTLQLVERIAARSRGRSVNTALVEIGARAAARRARLVASVTSASVLSAAQQKRLQALLEKMYDRPLQLNIAVDPALLGGLRIQVGSEVVDATVLGRLDDARRRLAG